MDVNEMKKNKICNLNFVEAVKLIYEATSNNFEPQIESKPRLTGRDGRSLQCNGTNEYEAMDYICKGPIELCYKCRYEKREQNGDIK